MNPNRTPRVEVGQIYLNEQMNEYLIVTKNVRGQIWYEGSGFRGQLEDYDFTEKFPAVDPQDVDPSEIKYLLSFCPEGTEASIGFVDE
ncbi:hypothetical protein [Acinetobacter sp.]|uniref:hypothetical protein n=1 Tax=Acinetobacter sp. TaxID=472 RepID=UPI00388D1A93